MVVAVMMTIESIVVLFEENIYTRWAGLVVIMTKESIVVFFEEKSLRANILTGRVV